MVSEVDLTNAMVETLKRIPPLMALLDPANGVQAYIDRNPDRNSANKEVYQQPNGSLLVIWQGTTLETTDDSMEAWIHLIQIFIRARLNASAMPIFHALVNGIPVPGDGLRWRYCPLMPGVLPTVVKEHARLIDEEGIDYFVATTVTQETGDTE